MSSEEIKAMLEKVKKDNIKFVSMEFSDVVGTVKSVTIPTDKLKDAMEQGLWFDGSSIEGFTRIHESDMYLMPDLNTYAVIPWHDRPEKTARFICDVHMPDGKPFKGDPRHILKKMMGKSAKMGYTFNTGPELEFFLFRTENGRLLTSENKPIKTHDVGKYFDLSMDLAFDVRKDMVLALEKMGLEIEASHHEVAPGQHEIDFKYDNALKTADNALTFKYTLKAIAKKHDLHASFMPKPITGVNGNGMHVHQSLFNGDKNIFFDKSDKYHLSETAYNFLAGQLKHAGAMSAVLSPLVNSYKRLVPGYEAPTYVCWAQTNRSSLIRVPQYSPGKENATRLEIRCPDPSANPYLAFAVLLGAGLDGIKNKLMPPEPVEEDVYDFDDAKLAEKNIDQLPYSLWQAIKELKKNDVLNEVLGDHLMEQFVRSRTADWDSFRTSVTDWELKRYLEET